MIYNKWIDYECEKYDKKEEDEKIYEYMGKKDMKILELFKYTEPDELIDFKEGLLIIEKK
jgi:hypothetical protein